MRATGVDHAYTRTRNSSLMTDNIKKELEEVKLELKATYAVIEQLKKQLEQSRNDWMKACLEAETLLKKLTN